MLNLIKKLFSTGDGKHTVVVLNDDGSKDYTSHKFNPINLWFLCGGILAATVVLVVFLMVFTPLGSLFYNKQEVRESVITIQKQVAALQDSLAARNMQLQNLKQIMMSGKDASLQLDRSTNLNNLQAPAGNYMQDTSEMFLDINQFYLPDNAQLISNLLEQAPDFPTFWPVKGTLTRDFNSKNGHFGIDIAAKSGEPFKAVAAGVVIGKYWSKNYGYVLFIQHSNGIIMVYKHASQIEPEIGEPVSKGDILGRVGNTGVISSGPHLHMEVWQNGIPKKPLHYLIKS